ncbi:hypothetical protein POJ06DRAFT_256334 [Lipomyces tetrasporus]|uniref:P-type Na(+) transporter n=1 Tax=Lipomyces tetrasporus TaxID=54092 RepID=A0AAD7QPW3_9ASCO|nr:uncharacterized protein POJ06DRAFT_256334 [Lipomyces tetrasporus]KAJ8099209.1 hypothetical protein POJ06DRAFT_256334 [Lipomyces tetrasporus]
MVNKKKDETSQTHYSVPPYRQSFVQVADELNTNVETGLTVVEAERRLSEYGQNKLDGESGVSLMKVIARQCTNAMGLVLVLAMALSYGVNDYVEGGVITAVIVLNIVVGVVQEYRAEQTIDSLRSLLSPTAAVVRDGVVDHIPSLNVVPGDVVVINTGDVLPADVRLIETMNFETDEALLTGESLPVLKDHAIAFADEVGVGDRINLAYSSSTVTKGRARGVVVATGMATEIGRIAASLAGKKRKSGRSMNARKYGPLQLVRGFSLRLWDAIGSFLGLTVGTPLQRKLALLAYFLLCFACLLALIVFAVNNFNASHEVAIYAISLGIAIIPESLIAVLTITMAVGMRRMVARRVLVRKLDALEALGGVTNICSDKTGTLTQGKMLTRKAWIPGVGVYSLTESRSSVDPTSGNVELVPYTPPYLENDKEDDMSPIAVSSTAEFTPSGFDETMAGTNSMIVNPSLPEVTNDLAAFLEACALCNIATIRFDNDKSQWIATGDPTEIALQVFAHRFSYGKKSLIERGWSQQAEYPFDSDVKRMSVIFEGPLAEKSANRGEVIVFTKGAVERVLDLCTGIGMGSNYEVMSEGKRAEIMSVVTDLAGQGLRVLAIARRVEQNPKPSYLDYTRDLVEKELTLLGLAGIYDPPRLETKGAVMQCVAAGIKVHMLTGDHPGTAQTIAREVGIIPRNSDDLPPRVANTLVMTASQFDALTDEEIDKLETLPRVIARCAPNTKVRMIEALHRRSAYAAMTGDGVNDSPSLKMADVGIAMGMGGSDVAKSASDLVLTDDNFASIVSAVEEGRRMFENIQKFILHLLASNVAEVLLLVVGLAFKDDSGLSVFPLAPLQILWINMITSPGPAFGLSLEPASNDIMKRPPRDNKKGIFSWEIVADTLVCGCIMGACCLMSFTVIVYGHGNGELGENCNTEYNDSCDVVFRARAAMFAQLTWLILISAWEFKSLRRSMFRLNADDKSTFPFFKDMYRNKFLFFSVLIGALSVFLVIHIPTLNTDVFKMKAITWEWSLLAVVMVIFICGVEAWKFIKRKTGWFAQHQVMSETDLMLA